MTWNAPSNTGDSSITGYVIQHSTSSSMTGAQAVPVGTGDSPHTITGLTPGARY
ncbi:fibronectin type III domain-containing protein [Salinibacterium sp. SWN139]|uniref:fibronectin type III domain-containing protein n=1 Tax=Salinibacterium sp. SWN139 TaxID=2792055 RepID=UPI0035AEB269